jgi:hypothetical protein
MVPAPRLFPELVAQIRSPAGGMTDTKALDDTLADMPATAEFQNRLADIMHASTAYQELRESLARLANNLRPQLSPAVTHRPGNASDTDQEMAAGNDRDMPSD